MIKIDFQEPDTNEWRDWRIQCEGEQEAHNALVEAGTPAKAKGRVYKGTRYNIKQNIYMSIDGPFHGKCAFCEALIAADQPGDMEHFRPKGRVTDANNQDIPKEDGSPHPGYYWLAYNCKNLLPVCKDCNSPSSDNSGGVRIGKWNQFPVEDYRAERPGEEVNEKPLLINPVLENPNEHMKLARNGVFAARNGSSKGQTCIDIFGLNLREALVKSRKGVYKSVKNDVDMLIIHLLNRSDEVQERLTEIKDIWEGKKAYSAAGRLAIMERAPVLKQIFGLKDIA